MKFKAVLKLSYTVEASDHDEAKQKALWLINDDEESFRNKITVVRVS